MLYPLSILKDLSALKSVSLFGIAGHLTAMGALAARVADQSYRPGGAFAPAAAAAAQAKARAVAAAEAGGSDASKVGGWVGEGESWVRGNFTHITPPIHPQYAPNLSILRTQFTHITHPIHPHYAPNLSI